MQSMDELGKKKAANLCFVGFAASSVDLDGYRDPDFGGDGGVRTRVRQHSTIGTTCLVTLLD